MLLIFLDIETNGLNSDEDSPIEIALKCLDSKDFSQVYSFSSLINIGASLFTFSDPYAMKVNGITWDEIEEKGRSKNEIGDILLDFFFDVSLDRKSSIIICQNPSFDRMFFNKIIDESKQVSFKIHYHWLDLASIALGAGIIDITSDNFSTSKDRIASILGVAPEARPHRAMNGVDHLIECYKKIMSK